MKENKMTKITDRMKKPLDTTKVRGKTYLMEVMIEKPLSVFRVGEAKVYLDNGFHYLEQRKIFMKLPIEKINREIDKGNITIERIVLERI